MMLREDYLIIKSNAGHAREWYVEECLNLYKACKPKSVGRNPIVKLVLYRAYAEGRQTPTGFYKKGKPINLDRVYSTGIDTGSWPLPGLTEGDRRAMLIW